LPVVSVICKLNYESDRTILKGGKWDLIFLGGRGVGGNIKSGWAAGNIGYRQPPVKVWQKGSEGWGGGWLPVASVIGKTL